jgi:hypothetical protein
LFKEDFYAGMEELVFGVTMKFSRMNLVGLPKNFDL